VFALSGGLAGLAGLVQIGRINAADPSAGLLFELTAITAAIIDGINLFGGRGTVIGTVIGALIMGVIRNGLELKRELKRRGITVILISHRLTDVFEVSDRIIALRQGQVFAIEAYPTRP
jgi:ribose/xylose/arabinose/galactoside ABC-type transport system permease subunit